MLSKAGARKKIGEGTNSLKLLNEIEAISKALYLEKNPVKSSSSITNNRSKSAGKAPLLDAKGKLKYNNEDPSIKDKKSIWNWKPLKAFSSVKNRRFNCCFSLQVHSIEGLPRSFNDVSLLVHWKRRDEGLETRPAKVLDGTVEFEEKLTHTCSVYGSRNGPHHSAKYEAKHFLLYASVFGAPELDLGKHRVDLTRLLPLTLEELEDEKSSGKWTTSFKLSGKAKGATMNVSFGYMVIGDNAIPNGSNKSVHELANVKRNNLGMIKPITKFGVHDVKSTMQQSGSIPGRVTQLSRSSTQSTEDIKDLHEVLPTSRSELASSVQMLYKKFDEEKLDSSIDHRPELDSAAGHLEPIKPHSYVMSVSGKENVDNQCEDNEFTVIEQGIELLSEEHVKSPELTVKTAFNSTLKGPEVSEVDTSAPAFKEGKLSQDGNNVSDMDDVVGSYCSSKEDDVYSKESLMKDLESALISVSNVVLEAADSPERPENHMEINSDHNVIGLGRSRSLDDVTASVATEFFDKLGIEYSPFGLSSESEPDSPRERLLRQFEKDALAGGYSLFDFGIGDEDQAEFVYDAPTVSESGILNEDFEPPSVVQAAEEEPWMSTQDLKSKRKAAMLEDLETEALMREWGLNEKAFQSSPNESSSGFGSPIDLPSEEPFQLPLLGEGMGPFLQTKNGGFLRSMNPSLFSNAKSGGSLIMQVSSPVVVPADMGSGVMEILQRLASVGIEKLSMQANKLMPLEDITGKTMQQVAWEAAPTLEGLESQYILHHESEVRQDFSDVQKRVNGGSSGSRPSKLSSTSAGNEICSEYVSLEDLAPLAMDKIEALSMEGLRIQSGMSDEDAPSNINARSIGEISALQGKGVHMTGSLGLEGTGGLQLLDIKDNCEEVDGLMGLSLTLDEWMRLDSGEIYDEDQISERTSKILAAHHATSLDLIRGGSKGERRRGKGSGRKYGLLGNNFTVALMVQLRDPLRNYEPVGAPMLSLIQVERVFVPPKPKIYCKVPEVRNNSEEDDESESTGKEAKKETKEEKAAEEEGIPQFRITEVHVAGLKTEPEKKLWGTKTQQQSGSRWLLANGMGKNNKHPFMKSKTVSKSSAPPTAKVQPGDTLWSISSRIHGTGAKWKELAALNPHIRNPNVIFPNETIRLQ
ncbi:hypothetical protein Pint_13453 [Pistacia integerrima]|uniref:Uncharacterized protein n=1 Tax=Pistacia integerrima TaxID=434235 RepID=A0ACC0Y850_9ROSI|nr:hypothetical protein Pint_13453 [Pistacia integerrima]